MSSRRLKLNYKIFLLVLGGVMVVLFLGGPVSVFTAEVTIDSSISDATDQFNTGAAVVGISETTAYVFYVDSGRQVVYKKSTDGGASWGPTVTIDSGLDNTDVGIWYDQWTPGDTGTKIHIVWRDTGSDYLWYRNLDTSTDTFGAAAIMIVDLGYVSQGSRMQPSIAKATDGDLYAGAGGSSGGFIYKSTDGGVNWTNTSATFLDDYDQVSLMPLSGGDILCIYWKDASDDLLSRVYHDSTASWDASDATIDTNLYTYSGCKITWGASVYKSTGDIYLVLNSDPNYDTGDLRAYKYSAGSWSNLTNIATGQRGYDVKVSVDENSGELYTIYTRRISLGMHDVYYKKSSDGGLSWSGETKINSVQDDLRIVRPALMGSKRAYVIWYNDDLNYILGETIALGVPEIISVSDTPDPVVVGSAITFEADWSDPGDQTKIHICKTDAISGQTCTGGSWCDTTTWDSTPPSSCSYTTTGADEGTNNYYAFVCDDEDVCSPSQSGTFTAVSSPAVSTASSTNIQDTQAQLNGDLTDIGGATSCDVWFQWGTTTSYGSETTHNSKSSTGSFSDTITGLSPLTTYHFRAVAQNAADTVYGLDEEFTTTAAILDTGWKSPSANNSYWANSPQEAYSQNNTPAYPNNGQTGVQQYYNYGITISGGATIQGIEVKVRARDYWNDGGEYYYVKLSWDGGSNWTSEKRVPSSGSLPGSWTDYSAGGTSDNWGRSWSTTDFSDANFKVGIRVVSSMGYEEDAELDWIPVKVYYSTIAGAPEIISVSDSPDPVSAGETVTFTIDWSDPDDQTKIHICKTNAITGQSCDGGSWCDTENWDSTPPSSCLYSTVDADEGTNNYYAFVCDDENICSSQAGTFTVVSSPAVTTNPASNVEVSQAQLNGDLTDMGGATSCTIWFEWGTSTSYTNETTHYSKSSTGNFSDTITGLDPGIIYHFRAVAQNAGGTTYGADQEFTTETTLTLRPNAEGTYTEFETVYPAADAQGFHWDKVDEEEEDGDMTYVYTDSASYEKDAYALEDTSQTGSITEVRLCAVTEGCYRSYLRLNGVEQFSGSTRCGTPFSLSCSAISRPGGGSWTWDDINNLQAVIGLAISGSDAGRATQAYVEVDYDASTLTLRPNGEGDYTNIKYQVGGSSTYGEHWDKVDEAVAWGDGTYTFVQSLNPSTALRDLYELTDTGLPGDTTIDSVWVYTIAQRACDGYSEFNAMIRSGGTDSYGGSQGGNGEQTGWARFGQSWENDPATNASWTVAAVDALQAGQRINTGCYRVTQMYVEVNYPGGTVTLRPNGPGQYTEWEDQWQGGPCGATSYHWDKVDDEFIDYEQSYVYTDSFTEKKDAYTLENTTATGTIENITIYARHMGCVNSYARLGGVEAGGGNHCSFGAWGTTAVNLSERPGGGSWTWDDINNLQVAVGLWRDPAYEDEPAQITQVYVNVSSTEGTITLRPDGEGDYTNIEWIRPEPWPCPTGAGPHWDKVDEITADDDATYVESIISGKRDTYNLTDSGLSGVGVGSVTVYVRAKRPNSTNNEFQIMIRSGTTDATGSTITMTDDLYNEYSQAWTTNPDTGSAWTITEIDALQAGAVLPGSGTRITQVWVEVALAGPSMGPNLVSCVDDATTTEPGQTIIFTGEWTDPNPGETVRLLISKDPNFTNCNYTNQSGCLAYSGPTTATSVTATYVTQSGDGDVVWYAQVCDDENLCDKAISREITKQVKASDDDAYEGDISGLDITGTSVLVGNGGGVIYHGGFRFQDLEIIQGATVSSANLEVFSKQFRDNLLLNIHAEDIDDSPAFADTSGQRIFDRTTTAAFTPWDNYSFGNSDWEMSPDIGSAAQEVMARAGWSPGNSLTILVKDDGSPWAEHGALDTYDNSPTRAAKLHLGYSGNECGSFSVITVCQEHNVYSWAWSQELGWTSFSCQDIASPSEDYGVDITTSTGDFSGYAWSENKGRVYFHQASMGIPSENSLIGGWSLNEGEGNTIYDASLNNNDGTNSGGTWVQGKYNSGLSFNESGYVEIPDSPSLDHIYDKLTMEAWIKPSTPSNTGDWHTIVGKQSNPDEGGYNIFADQTQSVVYFHVDTDGGDISVNYTLPVMDEWYHVLGTFEQGPIMKLYVNGSLVDDTPETFGFGPFDGPIGSSRKSLYIGGDPKDNSAAPLEFKGVIDEVRIFSRVLSEPEIAAHYQSFASLNMGTKEVSGWARACTTTEGGYECGQADAVTSVMDQTGLAAGYYMDENTGVTINDSSPNNNNGTFSGNTTWANGRYNSGLYFDEAANTYVSVADDPTLDIVDAVSIEAWVKMGIPGYGISFGSETLFNGTTTNDISATFDSFNNKVVIAYKDVGNSNYGTAIVGTVSGTGISFGTPVVFNSAQTQEISSTFDTSSNKVVIAYQDLGNSQYGTAIVGTVSGTSISFGTPVVFESAESSYLSAAFDSYNNKVVIAYMDNPNSYYGTAVVGTVSGTSISFGTPVVFEDSRTSQKSVAFDSFNNKVVIAYKDVGNSNYGTAIVGTVSGTGISFGTPVVFNSADTAYPSAVFDTSSNKVVIAYGDNPIGTAIVGTVSGTSISFGSEVVFNSPATEAISATFDTSNNKVVIAYNDNAISSGAAIVGTVSGTNISFGSETVFNSGTNFYISSTFDSSNNKVVIAYRDEGNSSYGTAVVGTVQVAAIDYRTLVAKQDNNDGGYGLCANIAQDAIYFYVGNSSWIGVENITSPTEWHHVVGTYDEVQGRYTFYWDGEFLGDYYTAASLNPTDKPLYIGGDPIGNSVAPNEYQGLIDEVRVYNRVLNEPEVKEHYLGSMPSYSDTDTGWKSPLATGEYYNQWTNPTNAYSSNNLYARSSTTADDQDYYNFNFPDLSGSTIKGIQVDIEAYSYGDPSDDDCDVSLSWNGGSSWTSFKNKEVPTSEAYYTFGGSSDTWGRTWSPSDFTNANFRVYFDADDIYFDHIRVKVYYDTDVWDGWIRLRGQTTVPEEYGVYISGPDFYDWAWLGEGTPTGNKETEVSDWMLFNCQSCQSDPTCGASYPACSNPTHTDYRVMTSLFANQAPQVTSTETVMNTCAWGQVPQVASGVTLTLRWTYSDAESDPEDAFEIQVASSTNPTFSDPKFNYLATSTSATDYVLDLSDDQEGDWLSGLGWGGNYIWRVKVKDSYGNWSEWSSTTSFTMPSHSWPYPDWSYIPLSPKVEEIVTTTNSSLCYTTGGGTIPCSYFWTLPPEGSFATGSSATSEEPQFTFSEKGNFDVDLEAKDNGYACSLTQTIPVGFPLPEWKEIAPF